MCGYVCTVVLAVRDFVTTHCKVPIAVCCISLIAYAGWWSTQAVHIPNDSKDQIWKRHEFALLVESRPC